MAEITPDVEIKIVFRDKEIYRVIGPDGRDATRLTDAEFKRFKKSAYGLKLVDTAAAFDTRDPDDPLMVRCYMVIGGYKVEVPC
jgi:hypothetical protein